MPSYPEVPPFIGYFSAFHLELIVLYDGTMGMQQKLYCFDFILVWILSLKKKVLNVTLKKENIKIQFAFGNSILN